MGFDKKNVTNLNKIVEATGAKIVISSNWRLGRSLEQLKHLLKLNGLTENAEIIDITIDYGEIRLNEGILISLTREQEIQSWIAKNGDKIENFVILDDETTFKWLKSRWIQTFIEDGLTEELANKAIEILK